MKATKSIKAIFLMALFVLSLSSVASAANHKVLLINYTGRNIAAVNFVPESSNSWGKNINPWGNAFPHLAQITLYVDVTPNESTYAFRTVYDDGSSREWRDIYMKTVHKVIFYANGEADFE